MSGTATFREWGREAIQFFERTRTVYQGIGGTSL